MKNNGPRQLRQHGNVVSLVECFELFYLVLRNTYIRLGSKDLPEKRSLLGISARATASARQHVVVNIIYGYCSYDVGIHLTVLVL